MEIYVVKFYNCLNKTQNLFGKAFSNKKDAVNFICKKLNAKETENSFKNQKRGFLTDNEFVANNGTYTISSLNLVEGE